MLLKQQHLSLNWRHRLKYKPSFYQTFFHKMNLQSYCCSPFALSCQVNYEWPCKEWPNWYFTAFCLHINTCKAWLDPFIHHVNIIANPVCRGAKKKKIQLLIKDKPIHKKSSQQNIFTVQWFLRQVNRRKCFYCQYPLKASPDYDIRESIDM